MKIKSIIARWKFTGILVVVNSFAVNLSCKLCVYLATAFTRCFVTYKCHLQKSAIPSGIGDDVNIF